MINVNEFVPKLFLKLTSKTYPYGYEDIVVDEMVKLGYLPKDISKDSHGNYFYQIGESRSIFAAHLDTVSSKHQDVKHVLDGETIKTGGTTTLGADDKAGVTILIWMMKHNIPGTYYFFIGEESGCIGSGLAAKYGEFKGKYDRIISFDRRGTTSIITHQSWSRCCSDVFAEEINGEGYVIAAACSAAALVPVPNTFSAVPSKVNVNPPISCVASDLVNIVGPMAATCVDGVNVSSTPAGN